MLTDLDIARQVQLKNVDEIAAKIGLGAQDIDHYGEYKGKIRYTTLSKIQNNPYGKLILVSAITPTPAGEGKTTVAIGLSQALNQIGKNSIVAIREPSLGPLFGIKGGAADEG